MKFQLYDIPCKELAGGVCITQPNVEITELHKFQKMNFSMRNFNKSDKWRNIMKKCCNTVLSLGGY